MPRTALTRLPEKGVSDRQALDRLLDDVMIVQVGLVDDGHPVVLPTAGARDGDRMLIHGSTGSRWMRALAAGAPACISVTALDGVVVARSAFESSFRYRSATLFGTFTRVAGDDKLAALTVVTEHLIPGRTAEVRASTTKELAATVVLSMAIEEWSLKVSDGWPEDPDDDVAGDAWAGVVPVLGPRYGAPLPAPDLRPGIGMPASVTGFGTGQ